MMIQNGWWHHHHHHHHPIARHPSRRPRTRERSRSSRSASPGWSRARAAGKQRRRPFCALGLDREAMRCVSLSSSSNHLALSLRASYRGIILLDIYSLCRLLLSRSRERRQRRRQRRKRTTTRSSSLLLFFFFVFF